jgi:ribosomal-protein-alanine N-acetyltransferase
MLKGSLCRIRHVVERDLPEYLERYNDLSARGDFLPSTFRSPELAKAEFARTGFVDDEKENFVIVDADDRLLGSMSHFRVRSPHVREIGYSLFDRASHGKGVTTEAARMMVDYLFDNRAELNRLQLLMDPGNAASERVAQKCGFTREGTLRGMFFKRGGYTDVHVYALLRAEWAAAR